MHAGRSVAALTMLLFTAVGSRDAATTPAGPGEVQLLASEPGGQTRARFPLTVGLPFARGVLAREAAVAPLDESGRPGPVQTRVLERHVDGSVKWLLVDYQGDFTPFGVSRTTLALGRKATEPAEGNRIVVSEQGDALLVDNGVLRLELPRRRTLPLTQVWYRGKLVSSGGLDFRVTAPSGERFSAANDPAPRFELEEPGPLRLVASWRGTHRSSAGTKHFDYLVRLSIYAGSPFVRVDHVFTNRLDPDVTAVKEIVARLPVRLEGRLDYTVGDLYRARLASPFFKATEPVRLEQHSLGDMRIVGLGGKVLKGAVTAASGAGKTNSRGWVDASGDHEGLLLAGKNFWQNYPKAIAAGPDAFECFLIPDRGTAFPVPRGMAKTHTFYLSFHRGREETVDRADLAYLVQRWPMPAAPSEYYPGTGELWDFFPYYPKQYPRLEAAFREMFAPDRHDGPLDVSPGRAYGLKHYGDLVVRPEGTAFDPDAPDTYYLNNEYDTPHVLAMLFLRSREITKWWGAEAHALHMMDIDTCHHAVPLPTLPKQDPKILQDAQYRHCYQHVGGIQTPGSMAVEPLHSHTFAQGLLDYYHLTGDRQALETALGYARNLAYKTNHYDRYKWGIGRESGWALLVLGGAYMARPDEEVRKAGDTMVERIRAQQGPAGEVLEGYFHAKAFEDRTITLCVRGLIKWHQATGDEKVKNLIVGLMRGYLRMAFGAEGVALAGSWPEHQKASTPEQGFADLESLAYAYELTGDRSFIDAGVPALSHAVDWIVNAQERSEGYLFQRILRGPLPFLRAAHQLGLMQRLPSAGGWLTDGPGR
jgi:hypothetical protein